MVSIVGIFTGAESNASVIPFFVPIGLIGLYRLLLFVIRLVCYIKYKSIEPSPDNQYASHDVTVIVPTIDPGREFLSAAKRWLINDPYEVIVVTTEPLKDRVVEVVSNINPTKFRVLTVKHANKREQLVKGINASQTPILALSDDDAVWSKKFLPWMLAPFDKSTLGGVGSSQEMMPDGDSKTIWEIVADMRLSMRMMEAASTTYADGGISCLSGRTAVYRSEILKSDEFQEAFVNEKWLGKYPLNSGDDKFITRWLVSHNWEMQFQFDKEATLKTTFKPNWRFLMQLLRWTRNTWRSDFRSLFVDRHVWRRYPYVAFNMVDKMVNPLTLLYGPIFIVMLMCTHPNWSPLTIFITELCWIIFSRYIRLIEHWRRIPADLMYLPVYILFNYFFALLKVYALFTLHVTGWQTRDSEKELSLEEFDAVAVPMDANAEEEFDIELERIAKKMTSTKSYKLDTTRSATLRSKIESKNSLQVSLDLDAIALDATHQQVSAAAA